MLSSTSSTVQGRSAVAAAVLDCVSSLMVAFDIGGDLWWPLWLARQKNRTPIQRLAMREFFPGLFAFLELPGPLPRRGIRLSHSTQCDTRGDRIIRFATDSGRKTCQFVAPAVTPHDRNKAESTN